MVRVWGDVHVALCSSDRLKTLFSRVCLRTALIFVATHVVARHALLNTYSSLWFLVFSKIAIFVSPNGLFPSIFTSRHFSPAHENLLAL